jgi:hypothetical protein
VSIRLDPADRKIFFTAAAMILVLLAVAAFLKPEEELEDDHPSTYSAKSGGTKATYLLLQALGYRVERWTQPISVIEAPTEPTLLVLTGSEESAITDGKQAVAKFLQAGGTVLAAGFDTGSFLPSDGAMPSWGAGLKKSWDTYGSQAPSAITRVAPEIVMPRRGNWYELPAGGIPLYGKDREVVALEYPYGKGRVIWLASPAPLSNAGLKVNANVRFLSAVLTSVNPQRILWDEYSRESSAAFQFGSPATLALAGQFLLIFMFVLWTYGRRSGPIRPLYTEPRLSPLEFVDALGSLYRDRRAGQIAVECAFRKFKTQAQRRLGVSRKANAVDLARAVANRTGLDERASLSVIEACESAIYRPELHSREALKLYGELQQLEHAFSAKTKESPK